MSHLSLGSPISHQPFCPLPFCPFTAQPIKPLRSEAQLVPIMTRKGSTKVRTGCLTCKSVKALARGPDQVSVPTDSIHQGPQSEMRRREASLYKVFFYWPSLQRLPATCTTLSLHLPPPKRNSSVMLSNMELPSQPVKRHIHGQSFSILRGLRPSSKRGCRAASPA